MSDAKKSESKPTKPEQKPVHVETATAKSETKQETPKLDSSVYIG